jgi:hypothetical protein
MEKTAPNGPAPVPDDKAGLSPTVGRPVHVSDTDVRGPDGSVRPLKPKPRK